MRLILIDRLLPQRSNFHPLALCRPIWELRCGMGTLAEKLVAKLPSCGVACFVPPYLADVYRSQTAWPVNDPASLRGDDLLLVAGQVKPAGLEGMSSGPSRLVLDVGGEILVARITQADLARLPADSLDTLLTTAKQILPVAAGGPPPVWNYPWELILANAEQLSEDFRQAGRSGIEGTVEQPGVLRGNPKDLYVAPGAVVQPMVVLDAIHGPIYIDEGAEIEDLTVIATGTPSHASRGPATWGSTRFCWVPSAAKGTRSAPCAALAAKWKSRSSMATRTSITMVFSATPTWASG